MIVARVTYGGGGGVPCSFQVRALFRMMIRGYYWIPWLVYDECDAQGGGLEAASANQTHAEGDFPLTNDNTDKRMVAARLAIGTKTHRLFCVI